MVAIQSKSRLERQMRREDAIAVAVNALQGKTNKIPSAMDHVVAFRRLMELGAVPTSEPILPLMLNLKGEPYSLKDHFPFSPFFRTKRASTIVLKTGRQVSKSTSLAADGIVTSLVKDNFTTLFVTPRYEQIRRFSNNYVGDFLKQSPVQAMFMGYNVDNSVLQRSFKNHSKMIFSFALLDADRIRGVSAHKVAIDEVQDMDRDHIPIIRETMSYAKFPMTQFTGTPKTLDNFIETAWQSSSMAEWFIPCFACGKWNIPSMEYDLLEMIGPYRDDISDHQPGTICANPKCRRPINPRFGRWVHKEREKRWGYAGFHVPQVIMPIHYANRGKWVDLLDKQQGTGNIAPHIFINEVLGESASTGSQLVTLSDLKAVSLGENGLPWKNDVRNPDQRVIERAREAQMTVLGVDWGGGGEEGVSFTTLSLCAFFGTGRIEVLWGKRLLTPHEPIREALEILHWSQIFQPAYVAHDYTGAGVIRETFLVQCGIPLPSLIPFSYVGGTTHGLIQYKEPTINQPRPFYVLDKTRSLLTTCTAIKTGVLKFFQYDHKGDENRGLIHDFLGLVDEKREVPTSRDLYLIRRAEGFTDDFAQATNMACCAIWHKQQAWPNFAELTSVQLTPQQVAYAIGKDGGWTEEDISDGPDWF